MKLTLALVTALLTSTAASAAPLTEGSVSFRCEQEKGGYAFQLPTAEVPARIWLTKGPADQVGHELEVVDTMVARCPNCFTFAARTEVLGQKAEFSFSLHGKGVGFIPDLVVLVGGRPLQELACVRAK